jgi:predicted enzyme related to lactoylglutathione lyase
LPTTVKEEAMPRIHHTINYIEFPCMRPERMRAFYGEVFGWTFEDYGPSYLAFHDGSMDGGFTADATVSQTGTLVVLYSSDLESTLSSVKAHGGSIVKEIFSFPGGRRFHFQDPDGNILAVWSE